MKKIYHSNDKALESLINIYFAYNNTFLNIWEEDGKIKIDSHEDDIYFNSDDELIEFLEYEITETIKSLFA